MSICITFQSAYSVYRAVVSVSIYEHQCDYHTNYSGDDYYVTYYERYVINAQ